MNTYTISRVKEKPDWSVIPSLEMKPVQSYPLEIRAYGQIAYDEKGLFIHLWAYEPQIRAEEPKPYGNACDDSCLEFFFCPEKEDPQYFNIEFSASGCMYLGIGSGHHDLIRLVPDYTDCLFEPTIRILNGEWSIEYFIPFSFIQKFFSGFSPKSGKTIRANCYKCGDKTIQPHFLEWNPVSVKPHTFHSPKDFGTMVFS